MNNSYIEKILKELAQRNPQQPEYLQAVTEVLSTLETVIDAHPEYQKQAVLERLVEPERIIVFKVDLTRAASAFIRPLISAS